MTPPTNNSTRVEWGHDDDHPPIANQNCLNSANAACIPFPSRTRAIQNFLAGKLHLKREFIVQSVKSRSWQMGKDTVGCWVLPLCYKWPSPGLSICNSTPYTNDTHYKNARSLREYSPQIFPKNYIILLPGWTKKKNRSLHPSPFFPVVEQHQCPVDAYPLLALRTPQSTITPGDTPPLGICSHR